MIINLKLDAVNATVLDDSLPEVTKGVIASLEVTLFASDGVTAYPLAALGIDSWAFSISNNYLPDVPVLVSVTTGITAVDNIVTIPLTSSQLSSDELVLALGDQSRKKFTAEISGTDGTDLEFVRFFEIYCDNRISVG
jgi:hypothetical protein